MSPPFTVELEGRLLRLTLDTPGCQVNVFSLAAALQLRAILAEVDPQRIDAVTLETAKPGSFINGVGLMMANAVKRPSDVAVLTADVRAAYRALREVPVPTIALVSGACFGCGVELSLQCSHRVAADRADTRFYMTEIADYLFIPCFGGTVDLPRLLGLERATELLLWGQEWGSEEALRAGLVSASVDVARFQEDVPALVAEVLRRPMRAGPRPMPEGEETRVVASTRARIDGLPEAYRPVYRSCFELLARSARSPEQAAEGYRQELLASGHSVIADISKNAQSFFYVRQLALELCQREFSPPEAGLWFLEDLPALSERLRDKPQEVFASELGPDVAELRLGSLAAMSEMHAVVVLEPRPRLEPVGRADVLAYSPHFGGGSRFFEVALHPGRPREHALAVASALSRVGFEAVVTTPTAELAAPRLADALLRPIRRHVEAGGSLGDGSASLLALGFVRSSSSIVALGGWDTVPAPTDVDIGANVPALGEAVLLSLLVEVRRLRADGTVDHPSTADLIAREILDFPLGLGSLCRHMTVERARRSAGPRARGYLTADDSLVLEEYLGETRSFYS